jgi:hypothetical protein
LGFFIFGGKKEREGFTQREPRVATEYTEKFKKEMRNKIFTGVGS